MDRIVAIGDVGGHPDQLRDALAALGAAGPHLRLPAGLTVIQVGDLVDRGPDSAGVLDLVRWYLDEQPAQWIQLIGNHEAQYLPGGTLFWRDRLAPADADLLRAWWQDGRMQVAAALRTTDGDETLLTHSGLSVGAWRAIGEPTTAATAARRLNERPAIIWGGDDFAADTIVGPLWTEAGWELYEPWVQFHAAGGLVPFDQVHGHSQAVGFDNPATLPAPGYPPEVWQSPGRVRQRATVDRAARHVRVRIGDRTFTGIDPKHGRGGAPRWRPLVLDGAEILVGTDTFA